MDQSIQGEPDTRRQAPGGTEGTGEVARASGRPGPEPCAGRGCATRLKLPGAAREVSQIDRLRYLRLWRRPRRARTIPRQEGLRPVDSERVGLSFGDRLARSTFESRLLDRRHCGGAVWPIPQPCPTAATWPERPLQR